MSDLLLSHGQSKLQRCVKHKDAPGVVDADRMLGKNGIYYRVWEVELCGAFWKIGHWNKLVKTQLSVETKTKKSVR